MKQLQIKHGASIAVVILLSIVLLISAPNILRIVTTVPIVLFLPGFALTIILFRRDSLGVPERLLLSVGLSVALTALIGLTLHWTQWGLSPTTLWTALLLVLVAEVAVIILVRRPWTEPIHLPANPKFTPRQWILMSLAALVTGVAFFVARSPVDQQGFEGYTTLWIQPSDTPDTVRLGVRSEEFETTKYQIRFEANETVHEGPILELKPGESWQGLLRAPSDHVAGKPLTILLYRLDHPAEVYRHAVWWPE